MAAIAPTPVDPAPSVPDSSLDEPTFDAQFEAFLDWLAEDASPGFDALAQNAYDNAVLAEAAVGETAAAQTAAELAQAAAEAAQAFAESAESTAAAAAGTATTQAGISTTQAGIATTQAGIATAQAGLAATAKTGAETAQGLAEDARDAADGFRDQAEIFATQQLIGSSTTSLTPSVGSKSFAMETGRAFVAGMYLVATSTGTPSAKMAGYVTSYNAGTGALVLNVDAFGGTGAHADWAIGVAIAGQVGGITTQLLTTATTVNVVPNVEYIVGIAGLTLDMTSTTWAKGDAFAISEAIGTGTYTLNFGATKDRTRTRGSVAVSPRFLKYTRKFEDTTRGLI